MWTLLRLLGALIGGAVLLMTQTSDVVLRKVNSSVTESQPAATGGLEEFKRLARRSPQTYGFSSVAEVNAAGLGRPIVSFSIPLDQLRNYQPKDRPIALLTGGETVLYPVVSSGRVPSSITIEKNNIGWKTAAFGGSEIIRRLTEIRDRVNGQGTLTIMVEVAAPPAYFLAEVRGDQILLASLADQPDLKLRYGVFEPASTILRQLVPAAKAYNGLPQ